MQVRNFCIIAHIDHGKSTLSDRMLEETKTVEARKMHDQVLDTMELEQERGITIKMQPARMEYQKDGAPFILNLIDTPGHIDFTYEVSRALNAVEGVLLLVDSTQGVQAQTLSVLQMAKDLGLKIIPVLSKVDVAHARIDEVSDEIINLLGCEKGDILRASGKTGEGVPELLDAICEQIPAPAPSTVDTYRGLIFDFQYDNQLNLVNFLIEH